jgi:glutamine amidotransferase
MRPGTLWMFHDGEVVEQADTAPSPVQSLESSPLR